MTKLIALLQFLLALVGIHSGGTDYSYRIEESNGASIYGKAHSQDGVARFECIDSSSGLCHFTLYPRGCAGPSGCKQPPLRTFSIARGETQQIAGLSGFQLCVDPGNATLDASCKPAAAASARAAPTR